jgi:hypothetical protein
MRLITSSLTNSLSLRHLDLLYNESYHFPDVLKNTIRESRRCWPDCADLQYQKRYLL